MQKKNIKKIENLIIYFFIFSLIGWIAEILYAIKVEGTFVKRGFLYGPICPIYGFGAIILIMLNNIINKYTKSNIIKFVIFSIIFTVFEYLVSLVFEMIFNIRWWDYSNELLNLNGRICLMFSLIWGITGILFINHAYMPIKNKIETLQKNIPNYYVHIFVIVCTSGAIVDCILSSIKYLK